MLSDNESEDDPFGGTHTDSDEDYMPANKKRNIIRPPSTTSSSSNDSDKETQGAGTVPILLEDAPIISEGGSDQLSGILDNTSQRGKKRLVRKKTWKRNIQKARRTKGEPYINIAGNHKPGKHIGSNCHCKLKCFEEIGHEACKKIFRDFYAMESKDLQDAYLYGNIFKTEVQRARPRSGDGNKKNATFTYKIRLNGLMRKICKKAFLSMHGITKARLERLQKHLNMGYGTPPVDGRGKHVIRPNKLPAGTDDKIREHILSYPKYRSHYSLKDNLNHYYLSPLLSIAKMYQMYLEKYEPEQLLYENENIKPIVKYEYYRKFFTENFRMSFGKPKSDTCQKCDKLMNQINAADNEQQKKQLEIEKELHIKKAATFYTDIKEKTSLAQNDSSVEVLTFDFQQNLPLPVSSSGEVFYKIQLWVYNFCIHVGSTGKSFFYVYDETLAAKGQNDVASLLHHFLRSFIKEEVTDIYLFSDNCSSQNKNFVLVQFLYTMLATTGRFRLIQHRYPEPGHSFLPCDRSFGAIEIQKRKHDKIYLPQEYSKIIENTNKNFKVIHVTQDIFLNFKSHLQQFFVKNPSRKNNKFTISRYRIMRYEKLDSEISFKCSETVSFNNLLSAFEIRDKRNVQPLTLPNSSNNRMYSERRKLKKNKFDHVMTLAKNYVPKCDQWFYEEIRNYHQSFSPDDKESSASEFSDDE